MPDNLIDTLKYGGKMAIYVLVVLIISGIFLAPGAYLIVPQWGGGGAGMGTLAAGGVLLLIGVLALLGGTIGIQYKVIADAVDEGTEE